jgi:ribonuclease G
MEIAEHREQVLQALERALSEDPSKTKLSQVSPLGIVEMTRKRTRESLEHVLCQPCPTCHGRRYVKSPTTVAYEIFREIQRQSRQFEIKSLVILAHSDVVDLLLDEESAALGELELLVKKPIRLQNESLYAIDQFDVVLL